MNSKPAVMVTGAGSGIGAATARLFAEHGHDVILVGRRKELLAQVGASLPTQSLVIPTDVRNSHEVDRLVRETEKSFAHLGVLVNNAGVYERGNFREVQDEVWQKIYETNLLGPVRMIRGLIPLLRKNGNSCIINVASTAGLRPLEGMTAYSTMKAGLIHLTQSLALELAPEQIRVNAVCPGIIDTPILGLSEMDEAKKEEIRKHFAQAHPLGRMGKPEDVSWAIFQLSRPEAQWITGVVLPVDGGISCL